MTTKKSFAAILLLVALVLASVGAGLLSANHPASGHIDAPATAPGTLPAAALPPPWNVAPEPVPADAEPMWRDLHSIARVVTCMVDGDLVKNILTERAMEKAFTVDPRDQWAGSDNWDYNHDPFLRTKQTLTRAAYLAPGLVGCNLYMPAPARPGQWHMLLSTVYGGKQMLLRADMIGGEPDPELVQVFNTGRRVQVSKLENHYSVLTPVYDSMGLVVGVVEVFTREAGYNKIRK